MRYHISGRTARDDCLRRLLEENEISDLPPWDAVILALPYSVLPEGMESYLPEGQRIVCGKTDATFDAMAEKRGWRLFRVLEDEKYILENSALSAEGAMYSAMGKMNRSLRGAECLVIGYGHLGKALTRLLRAAGARVTVAARRPESRKAAGNHSVDIPDIPKIIEKMDAVFNTVPAPVVKRDALQNAHRETLFLELASAPYGIDRQAAQELGLRLFTEGGIPGKYCPLSAAETLLAYLRSEGLYHA